MNKTKIEWCDYTWNPVVGCTGVCPYCYARKMAHRFHRDFTPHWVDRNFERPFPKKPSRIFVNSMSDLADWTPVWVARVLERIHKHHDHLFLFLSKRPWEVPKWIEWQNTMLGYTATRQEDIRLLIKGDRDVSFLSLEPLHGTINLGGLKPRWIIVGAENGNRKGRVTPDAGWIEDIYEYAMDSKIPLFFKESLRSLWPFDGYDYFPQEFPGV
jgi:protein gp37